MGGLTVHPRISLRLALALGVSLAACALLPSPAPGQDGVKKDAENRFVNPGFEIAGVGTGGWHMDKGGGTVAEYVAERGDAAEGDYSARVTIGKIEEWGTQFGAGVDAGEKGKTYTFAVLAKSTKEPVTVDLQIERRAKPYDRAVSSKKFTLTKDGWQEIHCTFKVEKDFPEGWFAYISCGQPNSEYRADMFRLYEGEYVPYKEVARQADAAEGVHLFDLGASSEGPIAGDAIAKREGWTEVAEGDAAHAFKGDACLANNYLALVIRAKGKGAECYYKQGDQTVQGPALAPEGEDGAKAGAVASIKAVENTPNKALIEVEFADEAGKKISAQFLLGRNSPIVEVRPAQGTGKIRVEAHAKHALLPDTIAGDLVVSAQEVKEAAARFPSENMLVGLCDNGNAIVMCAWRSRDQKVGIALDGEGDARILSAVEIAAAGDKSVWVAVLSAPGIWFEQKISGLHPVKDRQLDWKVPFRALWRADYRRTDGLIDSWRLPIKKGPDDYEIVSLKKGRTMWTSSRGTFGYPGYVENDAAFLRNTRYESLPDLKYKPDGVVVIYPFQRVNKTPATAYGVVEVLSRALRDTPEAKVCEDLFAKRVERDKYPPTCAVTAEYEKIFDAKEEKAKKEELLKRLDAMDHFVLGIRSRIDEYIAWGKKFREFCAKEKAAKPQIAGLVDELDGIAARYDEVWERLKLGERNPPAAKVLIQKVIELIDGHDADKVEKIKQLGRDTRTIGGSQDHAIGDYRRLTKELRQTAGLRMIEAKDDAAFDFAREARQRTMEVLFEGFGHEGTFSEW